MRSTGLSEVMGSWNTMAILSPRRLRTSSSAHGDDVAPAKHDAAAGDTALILQQLNDRERRDALARAGLADDAQGLAGHDLETDAVDRADQACVGIEVRAQVSDFEDGRGAAPSWCAEV